MATKRQTVLASAPVCAECFDRDAEREANTRRCGECEALLEPASGCLGRAADDEPVFVLRAHDRIAPAIVRQWAEKARGLGASPLKIAGAMDLAVEMEQWQAVHQFKTPD